MNFAIRKLQALVCLWFCLSLGLGAPGMADAVEPAYQGVGVIKTRAGQGDEFAQDMLYTRCEHFAIKMNAVLPFIKKHLADQE